MKSENVREVIQNVQNNLNEVKIKLKDIESKINQKNQTTVPLIENVSFTRPNTTNVQSTNYYTQNVNGQTTTMMDHKIPTVNRKTTIMDHSFVLSDQKQFENNYLEIYEIKI